MNLEVNETSGDSMRSSGSDDVTDNYLVVLLIPGKSKARAICAIPFVLHSTPSVSRKSAWDCGAATFGKMLLYILSDAGNSRLRTLYQANAKKVDLKMTRFYLLKDVEHEIGGGIAVESKSSIRDTIELCGGLHKVICVEMVVPVLQDHHVSLCEMPDSADDGADGAPRLPPDSGVVLDETMTGTAGAKNIFGLLGAAAAAMSVLNSYPSKVTKATMTAKDRLFNSIVDYFHENKLAFRPDECDKIGSDMVSAITSVLWETDGHELRVFPSINRFSSVSSLPSTLAAIKNYVALQWVIESGSSRTEAIGFNFNTRWKQYNGGKPRCESRNLENAKAGLEKIVLSHWYTAKGLRCKINDKWDLLLRALKSAHTTITLEISKMKEKALAQAEYVKDVKTGARVVNASPTSTTYAIPIVSLSKGSVATKPWYSENKSLTQLWEAIDACLPFDIIDPVQVFDLAFTLSFSRSKKHTLFMSQIAVSGVPSKLLPETTNAGQSITMISLSYRGSHPNMYYFVKQPQLGNLVTINNVTQVVDQSLITNKLLEIVRTLEETLVKQTLKAIMRMKLIAFQAEEYTVDGFDADLLIERAIMLWSDDSPIPANIMDREKLSMLVEQALISVNMLDEDGVNPELIEDFQEELIVPSVYDEFINAIEVVIAQDQLHVVDSRRHGTEASGLSAGTTIGYLPLATSIKDLHRRATEILHAGASEDVIHRIPCLEWLRLQFQPSNPYSKLARRHTGRFPLMLSTQERTRRKANADAYYVVSLHKYFRCFAMLHSDNILMVGMDDKSKIPVGEPGFRKAALERNRRFIAAVTPEGQERAKAADHDQSSYFKLTPSVTLFHDIPRTTSQTIYKGQAVVVLKNSIFETSDPQRHAAELLKAIHCYHQSLLKCSRGGVASALGEKLPMERSVLVMNADGGADHSCRHFRSILWDMAICKILDLDMLVHYRCYGGGSYINPVERCMAPLSASLSGVSTERSMHPDPSVEKLLASAGSMTGLRNVEDKMVGSKVSVKQATIVSLANVIKDLEGIFRRTQYDQKFFMVGDKASEVELAKLEETLKSFYPGYDKSKCTWTDYEKLGTDDELLYNLLACPRHCNRTSYCFQFKKCNNPSGCEFDFCKPVRMDIEAFDALKFVPMPSPDPERPGKYLPFSKAFELTDRYCPSVMKRAKPVTEPLKVNFTTAAHVDDLPDMLVNKKARAWTRCTSCSKPRLLYSDSPLTTQSLDQLRDLEEHSDYVCGNEFIPEGHVLHRAWTRPAGSTMDGLGEDETSVSNEDAADPTSTGKRRKLGGVPYLNSCGIVVRRGLCCTDPIESTFYSMEDHKSSMDVFYRTKAFGTSVEGGVAPNGFCFACGGSEDMLVLERLDIIASGTPTVSPLCAGCRGRGIEFRTRKSCQTNNGRGSASKSAISTCWLTGMLCMARFKTKSNKILLYPAMVTSCGPKDEGPFDVWYFDGDKTEALPSSALEPFVALDSMVYAKFNNNSSSYFAARVTAINAPKGGPAELTKMLPRVTVDLLYTDDGETRANCPLSQIYRPLKESAFNATAPAAVTAGGNREGKRGIKRKRG